MADITLITGGCRSGKSGYAQRLAESLPGPRLYVATCPPVDEEMEARIRKHREGRDPALWNTAEETLDLESVLSGHEIYLIDCLALWVNNLMYADPEMTEGDIADRCRDLLAACDEVDGSIIFVTNEVGMGIVPGNEVARRYRDLLGRCNQVLAAGAQKVVLMACGIPMVLKEG